MRFNSVEKPGLATIASAYGFFERWGTNNIVSAVNDANIAQAGSPGSVSEVPTVVAMLIVKASILSKRWSGERAFVHSRTWIEVMN